jgi:U32 family peptidase
MNKLELLAPVGSFESLRAAVQNGANAVYLGGMEFSARASASNFDRDELKEAVEYAHIRDVNVFVTVNTLIKQNEIEDFIKYIKYLYDIDVDAIILQDIGMARLIKKLLPDFELHASTQMVAHSIEDVKYLEDIGFNRVVLARELNVDEIKYICDNTNVDIEVFVHGALCVCYSGQCLMSSMIGSRSGNRGRCAQPCRQKYKLIDLYNGEVLSTDGEYLLSPRDLNTIEDIDKIIESGVHSLKIEGRMKRPEYVATVIRSYRQAIEQYNNDNLINISGETINDLYTIFNRNFTKGYVLNQVGSDIMNPHKPNNVGLYVGQVIDYNRKTNKLKIKLENSLKKGDGINLGGGTIGRIIKNNEILERGNKGDIIEIDFVGEAKLNQQVYKTSDSELMTKAQKSYENEVENKKINVKADVMLKLNDYPKLTLKDEKGNIVDVSGDKLIEQAMKVALSEEKVISQLSKLGNTPYELIHININMDEHISIPISVLNQIRRNAIEELNNKRAVLNIRKYKETNVEYKPNKINKDRKNKIRVKVKNIEQLKASLKYSIDAIYYEDIKTLDTAINLGKEHNIKIIYSAPRILRNNDYKLLNKLNNIENIQVGNLGSINYLKNKNLYIDYYLNSFNSESINHFASHNASTVCISAELNTSEIEETLLYTNAEIESLVYGYVPLMVTEYCPMGVLTRDCNKDKRCDTCNKSIYSLRDIKGEEYRLSQDMFCRTTIYNSTTLCMLDDLITLHDIGIDVFRLDFTSEKSDEVDNILNAFTLTINNNFKICMEHKDVYDNLNKNGENTGHYYRGVE